MTELEKLQTRLKELKNVISISHDEIRLIENQMDEPLFDAYRANLVGRCFKSVDGYSNWYKILEVKRVYGRQIVCHTIDVNENSIEFHEIYHANTSEPIPNAEFDTALNDLLQKINQFK